MDYPHFNTLLQAVLNLLWFVTEVHQVDWGVNVFLCSSIFSLFPSSVFSFFLVNHQHIIIVAKTQNNRLPSLFKRN